MATKYPNNTSYVDNQNTGTSEFPDLMKFLKSYTPPVNASSAAANVPVDPKYVQSPRVSEYGSPTPASVSDVYKNLKFIPSNTAIGTRSSDPTEPVPTGYNEFQPGKIGPDGKPMWVTASDQTYVQNYPENLGGGQYAIDPTQPDEIVKSYRGSTPQDQLETTLMRAGRSPYNTQIDHIIPLNMGGMDTLANKQALSTAEHEQKTKAQAIPLTLLAQGKISAAEARNMTLNWRSFDVKDLPMPDQFGYLTNMPYDVTKKYNINNQDSKSAYYKALGMDDAAEKAKQQWDWDQQHPPGTFGHSFTDSVKSVWKAIPQELNDVLGNSIGGEFAKGLVEGGTAGIIHAAPEEDNGGFWGVAARVAGNAIGMFVPMGLFAKGLGLLGRALEEIPAVARAFSAPTSILRPLPWLGSVAEGVKGVSAAGEEASSATKAISKIKGIFKGGKTAETLGTAAEEGIPIEQITNRGFLNPGAKVNTALFFGSYAVASELAQNGMNGEDMGNFSDYVKNFTTNAITGSIFSSADQNLKGYAKIAATSYVMGAMNGDTAQDNLANMLTMVGLHGMGSEKAKKIGATVKGIPESGVSGKKLTELENQMDTVANKMSHDFLNKWAPDSTTSASSPGEKYSAKEFKNIQKEAITNIQQQAFQENWTPAKIQAEISKVPVAVRQLDKGGMGRIARQVADIADVKSAAQKVVNDPNVPTVDKGSVPIKVHDLYGGETERPLSPVDFTEKGSGTFSVHGPVPITGGTSALNEKNGFHDNLMKYEAAKQAGMTTDDIYYTDRGADYLAQRMNENQTLAGAVHKDTGTPFVPYKHPENTVEAYVKIKIPETGQWDFLPIGFVARENRIGNMNKVTANKITESSYFRYPVENNKDTLSDAMRKNGVSIVTGKIMPLVTDPTPGGIKIKGNRLSGKQEFHVRGFISDGRWQDAINAEHEYKSKPAEQTSPTKPVTEDGFRPVEKDEVLANGYTTKMNQRTGEQMTNAPMKPAVSDLASKINQKATAEPRGELTENEKDALKKIGVNPEVIENARIKPLVDEVKTLDTTQTPPATEKAPLESSAASEKPLNRPNTGQFEIVGRKTEGVESLAASIVKDPKARQDFTRAKLTKIAKEVSNNGEERSDVIEGWPKFLDKYNEKIQQSIGEPFEGVTNKRDLADLKKLYTNLARTGTRDEVVVSADGAKLEKGSAANVGKIDLITKKFNKEEGLPEDAMKVVHVSKNSDYTGVEDNMKSSNKFKSLVDKMSNLNGKKYLPIGITGKGLDNAVFIEFNQKMADRVDSNPSKYLNDGEKLTSADDKFVRAYMVDVLGMAKNMKDGDMVKRANLIFHRYDQYTGPDANITLKTIKANKIADDASLKTGVEKFESPDSKEAKAAVEGFHEGKIEDGQAYMGEEAFDKYIKGLNYKPEEHRGSVKAIIDSSINGEKIYHKAQFTKVDPAIRAHLKEMHGIDVGPNDVISYDSNAKVGPKSGQAEIPLSDLYAKSKSTAESGGRDTPSFERKFLSTDTGVKEDILANTKKNVKDLTEFNKEAMATKTKAEFEAVLNKYSERFGLSPESLFQGQAGKKTAFDLGAAKNNLGFEIGKLTKNFFIKGVMSPELSGSGMVNINAPIKMKFDGDNKPLRYVNDKEVVIGKEMLKKLGIKEGDPVMVHRDPSYDINNAVILKAVDGSKLGNTSLGRENGSVSPYNERIILQGDQDGDTMHITKIGEGGIPQSEVNAIKARGGLATPFTEVNPTKSGYTTAKSIQEKITDQLHGDDQTSWISTQARIMDEVKDNNIKIKVYPSTVEPGGYRKISKYEIIANNKVVDSGETAASPVGFTAAPKWGLKERQLVSQAQREAVDSKKSRDIYDRTEGNNPNWAIKNLWGVSDGMNDIKARALNGAIKNIQKPYNIDKLAENANSIDDILKGQEKYNRKTSKMEPDKSTGIAPTIEYYKNLKDAGVELTPRQEKVLSVADMDTFKISKDTIIAAHKAGADAVTREFKSKVDDKNPKLTEIRKVALQAKKTYLENSGAEGSKKLGAKEKRDSAKASVEDLFFKRMDEGMYKPSDLKDIAYWAASSPEANITHDTVRFPKKPNFIYSYRDMINSDPEIAKAYYEGSESYEPPMDGQGGPGISKYNLFGRKEATGDNEKGATSKFKGMVENIKNMK